MKAFADDLRFAQTAELAVRIRTMSGEEFLAGVHEVRDDKGFVSLYAPQHHGDDQTRRKLDYDLIESLTVTDIKWGASGEPRRVIMLRSRAAQYAWGRYSVEKIAASSWSVVPMRTTAPARV